MNSIDKHLKYMKFKGRLKQIPFFSNVMRNIKWRLYRPVFIRLWTIKRNIEYSLKSKGFGSWTDNEKKLMALKDSHQGEIAFIVGNGPSLRASDLDSLKEKNIYCFGTNRINLIFNQTRWKPNCYLTLDRQIYKDNDQTISEVLKENIELYLFGQEVYGGLSASMKSDNILYFYRKTNSYYLPVNDFSANALKYVVDGFTVTYAALQIAYYMGFKEIYLIGVDCNYNKCLCKDGRVEENQEKTTYFDKRYDPNGHNSGYIQGMLEAYSTAENFSKDRDFKIYNSTRNGKLAIFEQINLDELLARI